MHIKESYPEWDDEIIIDINTSSFKWRVVMVYIMLAGVFAFLLLGAFQLQLIEGGKNLLIASRTNQAQTRISASRGLIFDSNGITLASNTPSYSLYVKPSGLDVADEEKVIIQTAQLLGMDQAEFYESYKSKVYNSEGVRSSAERVTLKSNLTFEQYFNVLSRIEELSGISVNVEAVRKYNDAQMFSNIIGYIGDPTQTDIDNGIYPESQVGKIGIERQYDQFLRGKDGSIITAKETLTGKQTQSQLIDAEAGGNVYLNIDAKWQIYLNNILSNVVSSSNAFGGAVTVMNSKTGEIKALVSNPGYDNNLFANGISSKDYAELINNPKKPLFNRPISMQLPPGSIMKIFGAVAILESGTITEDTKYLSDRCLDLPGNIRFCEADSGYLGWVDVKQAMARSSNIFFCKAMQDLRDKVGYAYYYDIARSFGMGLKTGIDIEGEVAGVLPSADYKKQLFNQPWYIGDECNTVIGQGYVTATPIQMTVAISAIVNGGNVLKPQLVDKILDQSGQEVFNSQTEVLRKLNISDKTLQILKEGLRMGVTEGTLGSLKNLPGNPIGKTGSSDAGEWINGKYYSGAHSWVMGCFDFEEEQYCYTVMQQWGGRGYRTVPVMKKFINCLYNDFSNNCEAI